MDLLFDACLDKLTASLAKIEEEATLRMEDVEDVSDIETHDSEFAGEESCPTGAQFIIVSV